MGGVFKSQFCDLWRMFEVEEFGEDLHFDHRGVEIRDIPAILQVLHRQNLLQIRLHGAEIFRVVMDFGAVQLRLQPVPLFLHLRPPRQSAARGPSFEHHVHEQMTQCHLV